MQTEQLKALVIESLEDLKGVDITCIDVHELTGVTDTLVIATGNSNRHVKSLAENVAVTCKENGIRPLGSEGQEGGEWVLVDLGSLVVHVMLPAARQFYDLEGLWQTTAEKREAQS